MRGMLSREVPYCPATIRCLPGIFRCVALEGTRECGRTGIEYACARTTTLEPQDGRNEDRLLRHCLRLQIERAGRQERPASPIFMGKTGLPVSQPFRATVYSALRSVLRDGSTLTQAPLDSEPSILQVIENAKKMGRKKLISHLQANCLAALNRGFVGSQRELVYAPNV